MEELEPTTIYKDDDLIVLTKPAGMIVNNADTSKRVFTLQDFVLKNYRIKFNNSDSDFNKRGGIVHRLDKDTSGAIIVALNEKSFNELQIQFKNRTIKKKYKALVHGKLVEEGEINVPIGRLPWNRMRFGVIPKGRNSFTKFKSREYRIFNNGKNEEILTLVDVFPETGRTHQIRVHFQYVGFPVFGDSLYAGRKIYARDKKYLNRHFLHASEITFNHPVSGREINVISPLTPELKDFLSKLRMLKLES